MPGTGLEPVQPRGPRDFKSLASTNSATQAFLLSHFLFYRFFFLPDKIRINIARTATVGYVTTYVTERAILFAGRAFVRRSVSPECISAT